ncbi:MAG: hypothetical protein D6794_03970 [Deltaproteobacteria bacterium]|nr:MAG: hypothetical protein D6794_03970 [Deltaproteobacteria bacterium]
MISEQVDALIKPQFEVHPRHLIKGVVCDEAVRGQVIEDILDFVRRELPNAAIIGVTESPIHGPKGNVEYLLGLRREKTIEGRC